VNEKDLGQSKIGLGLAALGRPGYINLGHDEDLGADKSVKGLEQQAHTVLDAAWEAGVRYFDAARSYGRAEAFLGSWVKSREIPKDEVAVGSKWGYRYVADWQSEAQVHEIKEHSLEMLQRQLVESQDYLVDYLDLYQIHSATEESGVLGNAKVLDALAQMKTEGLLIGLTLSGPRQAVTLDRALDVRRDGVLLFDAVQATWNVLERSVGGALEAAHEAGLLVIVKEALANGRLTERNNKPDFAKQRAMLDEMAQSLNSSIDAVAIAGVLAQSWADIVLSGAAKVEHLLSNLGALDVQLGTEDLEGLVDLAEGAEDYWKNRATLDWN
jgi:aryl-alcohol dehydrogenase-like predicted oxidoreductase